MPAFLRTRLIAVALLGAPLGFAAGAHPALAEPLDPNDPILRQTTPAEIQVLQSQQRRLDYQQQQRNLRTTDRATAGAPQPRLNVPIMQPRRPVQTFGNSYMQ
jgi:hypothetical protein